MTDPITRAAEALWVTGPLRVQRRFLSTRGVAGDGHHLALLPPLAVVAPVVVAVGYFLAGAFGLGFTEVFSESLLLMGALIALGAFSGQLGLIGLVAFAVGDFLIGHRIWTVEVGVDSSLLEQVIRARVPLIISYLLLAVAVIVIPRLGKNIALGIGQWKRVPTDLAWLVTTPVVIIVSWLGLRTWAAMAPTLMRPYFVWRGGAPTVEAIQVFQAETSKLVAAGVAATVARQILNAVFIYLPSMKARLAALEGRAHQRLVARADGAPPPITQSAAARLVSDLVSALTASLVMAGILETRTLWVTTFITFLVVRLLRTGTIRFGLLERWKSTAARIPVVVRLGCMWLGAALYRTLLTNEAIGSYTAMSFVVIGGVVLAFFIFPGQPSESAEPRPPIGGRWPLATRGAAVVGLGIAMAMLVAGLDAGPAAADNCSVFTDCFGQSEAASEAALGLTALAALSLIIDFIGGRGWNGFAGAGVFGGGDSRPWDRALGLIDLDPRSIDLNPFDDAAGLFGDLYGAVPDIGVWSLLNGSSGWLDWSGTADISAQVGGAVNHFFGTDVFDGDRWGSFFSQLGEGALEITSLQPASPENIRLMMTDPGELMSRYGSFGLGLWDFGSGTAQFVYDVSSLAPASPAWVMEANRWLSTGEHRGFQLAGQLAAAGEQLESLNPSSAAFYQELAEVIRTGSIADHEGVAAAGTMAVALVDWETFKEDPSRWFGRMTGEALLEIGTAGAASGIGLTDNAATAATRLDDLADPDAVRALDRTASPSGGPAATSPFRDLFSDRFSDLFGDFDPFNLNRQGDDLPPPPSSSTLPPLRPDGPPDPPASDQTGADPDNYLYRGDDAPSSSEGTKPGQLKSHVDPDTGNLVPANPDGSAEVFHHIRGQHPAKSDSPFTSVTPDGSIADRYGNQTIRIDRASLEADIASGKVTDVEIISSEQVQAALRDRIDELQARYDANPTQRNLDRLERAHLDLENAQRDGEYLIRGTVPAEYVEVVD